MHRKGRLDGPANETTGRTSSGGRDRVDHRTILHRTEGGWLVSWGASSAPARVRRRASASDRRSTQPLGEYFTNPPAPPSWPAAGGA